MKMEPSYIIWLCLIILILFNMLIYFHDPYLYSNATNCLHLKCKEYALFAGILTLVADVCLATSLTFINPIPYLPTYWFVGLAVIYIMLIYTNYNQADIVTQDEKFNPPPEGFFKKNFRIGFRIIILTLYIFIFLGRFSTETQPTIGVQPWTEKLLYNRFGGLTKPNAIPFFLSWASIIAIPIASIQLYKTVKYHPSNHNQPVSWSN